MKIVLHPKARQVLIAILIIVLPAIIFLGLRPWLFPRHEIAGMVIAPDAQAAVDAVTAFYSLDYTASPELWISNMCAVATNKGCRAIRSFYAPNVHAQVQKLQIQTGCAVQPVKLVEAEGDIHIWHVSATLDHPWEGLDAPTQDVYIEVAQEQGRWLMNRILFEQEIEQFNMPTP